MTSGPGNRRNISQEEEDYNDAIDDQIEAELDMMDDYIFGMQAGHIPGGYPEGWDEDMEAQYLGEASVVKTEVSTDSSPEDWKEFLRKIEEDLDG